MLYNPARYYRGVRCRFETDSFSGRAFRARVAILTAASAVSTPDSAADLADDAAVASVRSLVREARRRGLIAPEAE